MNEIDIKKQIGNLRYRIELNKHKSKLAEEYVERLLENLYKVATQEDYDKRQKRDVVLLNEIDNFLNEF